MISAIVPARNEEASIARAVTSLAAQAEVTEIIVVNDESTDGTAAVLSGIALRVPQLRVIEAGALPRGWVGKNFAVTLGARAASGDWLLFVDADTELLGGAVRRSLADAAEHRAAMVSYSPEQELRSIGEEILIPFVFCRLAEHFSFDRVNDPLAPAAAANGQFVMIRRDAYEAVGGHEAVRARVLEDVALARLVKGAGHNIYFAPGKGIARTRMYRSFGAMWQGWTKNLYELVGGTPWSLARELLETAPWIETILLALGLIAVARGRGWTIFLAWGLVVIGGHLRYERALRRNRLPLRYIQYWVLGAVLYSAALIASAWKTARGAVIWKGRKYSAGTLQ